MRGVLKLPAHADTCQAPTKLAERHQRPTEEVKEPILPAERVEVTETLLTCLEAIEFDTQVLVQHAEARDLVQEVRLSTFKDAPEVCESRSSVGHRTLPPANIFPR